MACHWPRPLSDILSLLWLFYSPPLRSDDFAVVWSWRITCRWAGVITSVSL